MRKTKQKKRRIDQDEEDFVNDLLSKMTLREKIGQMSQMEINALVQDDGNGGKKLDVEKAKKFIGEMGVGSVLNLVGGIGDSPWTASQYREIAMQLQKIAEDGEKPPVVWGMDSVRGANYLRDGTWTPSPLNIAATFNTTQAFVAGQWASHDTRVAGINWLFSPLLGLSWHSSFSRTYETFGEDPYLVGQFATALIQGIEGKDIYDGDNTAAATIPSMAAACAKHFVGYPLPRTGHDRAPSWIPTRHLYQYFVLPWKKVMKETNIMTVMESYTETDGVPNVANPQHLRYLLRYQLQFDGVLVTDYEEINNLNNWHHVVKEDGQSVAAATEYALRQGTVDMSMIPWNVDGFVDAAVNAVETRKVVDESRIHESAKRVLKLKYRLGMFREDQKMTADNAGATVNKQDEALEMTRQSLIVTENAQNFLPLKADSDGLKLLVTGATSNSRIAQTGGWTVGWQGPTSETESFTTGSTVYNAFLQHSEQAGSMFTSVAYSCGTDFLGGECTDEGTDTNGGGRNRKLGFLDSISDVSKQIGSGFNEGVSDVGDWFGWNGHSSDKNHTSIERAVDAAKDVDMVVICIGEEAYAEKPGDIRNPYLPLGQIELVRRMRIQYPDKAILLVYFGGRPRLLQETPQLSNAVVLGFLPGPHAGQALVDLVTGQYSPSARLPLTYPLASDMGGAPYFHTISDQCTKGEGIMPHYEYSPCAVQWPFGHGLSYVTFEYSGLKVSGNIESGITVSFQVTNKGTMKATEAAMVFTFDDFRLTTPEYKRLRAVQKVWLEPNQLLNLEFHIPSEDFRFVGPHDDRHYILDPTMSFWVGVGHATDCRTDPTHHLCKHVEPAQSQIENFNPSCELSCDLWMNDDSHSCGSQLGLLSLEDCTSLCQGSSNWPMDAASVGTEGWGWNYLSCIESVVWGFQREKQLDPASDADCAKMTTLCRDVFATPQLNEFGLGLGAVSSSNPGAIVPGKTIGMQGSDQIADGPSDAARIFGLIALLVGTVVVMLAMHGVSVVEMLLRRRPKERLPDGDNGQGVEMFSVSQGSNGNEGQERSMFSVLSSPTELLGRIEQHKRREFSSVPTS